MKDLDERIFEALSQEDRQLLDQYQEKNLFFQFTDTFRGQWLPYMIVTTFFGFAAAIFSGFCVYWYFGSEDSEVQHLSSIGFIISMMMIGFTKSQHYIHIGNMNVIREVKRLELQLSLMAEKIPTTK